MSILPIDKQLHLIYGAAIAYVIANALNVYLILTPGEASYYFDPQGIAFLAGGFGAGIIKEVYDLKVKKSYFDWNDVKYTVYGAFIGSVAAGITWGIIYKVFL